MPLIKATAIREALAHYSNYLRNLCAATDQSVEDAFDALPLEVQLEAIRVGRENLEKVVADQEKRYAASQAELASCISEYSVETAETLAEPRVRETVDMPSLTDEQAVIGNISPKGAGDADATGTP